MENKEKNKVNQGFKMGIVVSVNLNEGLIEIETENGKKIQAKPTVFNGVKTQKVVFYPKINCEVIFEDESKIEILSYDKVDSYIYDESCSIVEVEHISNSIKSAWKQAETLKNELIKRLKKKATD